jgi:hypothetical protein
MLTLYVSYLFRIHMLTSNVFSFVPNPLYLRLSRKATLLDPNEGGHKGRAPGSPHGLRICRGHIRQWQGSAFAHQLPQPRLCLPSHTPRAVAPHPSCRLDMDASGVSRLSVFSLHTPLSDTLAKPIYMRYIRIHHVQHETFPSRFLLRVSCFLQSGEYVPSASWCTPLAGKPIDAYRAERLWQFIFDAPGNIRRLVLVFNFNKFQVHTVSLYLFASTGMPACQCFLLRYNIATPAIFFRCYQGRCPSFLLRLYHIGNLLPRAPGGPLDCH